jgi:plastocyanin
VRISVISGLGAGFVLAVATACGGSTATQAPPAHTAAPGGGGAPSAAAGAGSATCAAGVGTGQQVAIAGFKFNPTPVTASSGTTVSWTNGDTATHTVTFDNGPDCGNVAQGQSVTATFSAAGTYTYHCKIHPSMTGTVTVS